jgi:PTS system galactosamine-specific IIC component
MPQFLIHGFQVAGGLIPAVGFALLLNVMLRNRYLGYLLAGFLFVCFIPFGNVLPVAVMGLSLALIDYYRNSEDNDKEGVNENEGI